MKPILYLLPQSLFVEERWKFGRGLHAAAFLIFLPLG